MHGAEDGPLSLKPGAIFHQAQYDGPASDEHRGAIEGDF